MSQELHRQVQEQEREPAARYTPSSCARDMENQAARLHHLSALRRMHFSLPLLADQGMSILLALFIGSLQGRSLSETEVSQANLISRQDLAMLMEQLIQAGLVALTGEDPGARSVGLTPIGSARMRSYMAVLPVV